MDALAALRDAGLSVELVDGERLRVTPAARLTPALRVVVVEHKADIVARLSVPPHDSPLWRTVWPPTDWTPDAVRARHRERAAALLAELERLPRLSRDQRLERDYYRRWWCADAGDRLLEDKLAAVPSE